MRNRLANLATGIKTRARASLEDTPLSADVRAGDASEEATEFDDRLPLRRRRAFDRDLTEMASRCASGGEALALIMIDLDHFERVNDEHGHPVGDEVLLAVSQIVIRRLGRKRRCCRSRGTAGIRA